MCLIKSGCLFGSRTCKYAFIFKKKHDFDCIHFQKKITHTKNITGPKSELQESAEKEEEEQPSSSKGKAESTEPYEMLRLATQELLAQKFEHSMFTVSGFMDQYSLSLLSVGFCIFGLG